MSQDKKHGKTCFCVGCVAKFMRTKKATNIIASGTKGAVLQKFRAHKSRKK